MNADARLLQLRCRPDRGADQPVGEQGPPAVLLDHLDNLRRRHPFAILALPAQQQFGTGARLLAKSTCGCKCSSRCSSSIAERSSSTIAEYCCQSWPCSA
jgi:hypothetical protein